MNGLGQQLQRFTVALTQQAAVEELGDRLPIGLAGSLATVRPDQEKGLVRLDSVAIRSEILFSGVQQEDSHVTAVLAGQEGDQTDEVDAKQDSVHGKFLYLDSLNVATPMS